MSHKTYIHRTMPGEIRVGRIKYVDGEPVYPTFRGFTPVVVLTKTSEYGSLGPYELRDAEGRIMENIWQFSKVYETVPQVAVPYTVRYPRIVWRWDAERHLTPEGEITDEYWHWRTAGMRNAFAVRYPAGRENMNKCKYALAERGGAQLDYIESRRKIYIPWYIRLVKEKEQFKELVARWEGGENLLIIEMDGPHEESLTYYMDTYRVGEDFIDGDTMTASIPHYIRIMRDDPKHPFGHCYCLAMAILGYDAEF